jgi:hypothetical protein
LIFVGLNSLLQGLGLLLIEVSALLQLLLQLKDALLLLDVFPGDLWPILGEFVSKFLLLICQESDPSLEVLLLPYNLLLLILQLFLQRIDNQSEVFLELIVLFLQLFREVEVILL